MSYLSQFRELNPKYNKVSDEVLLEYLSRLDPDRFGNLSLEQVRYKATNDSWQVTKGLKAGVDQVQAQGYGAAALVGDFFENKALQDWGVEGYQRNMTEASLNQGDVQNFTDIDSGGEFLDWAGYTVGNLAPNLAATVAGGGLTGAVIKQGVKKGAERYIQREVTRGVSREVAEREAKKRVAKRVVAGQAAGTSAVSTGMSAGSIYGETGDASVAATHGAVMGALDALPVMRVLKRLGVSDAAEDAISRSVMGDLMRQGTLEGGTEAMQTLIEQHAKYWVDSNGESLLNNLGEVNWKQIVDATAAGTLGGTAMSGATSMVSSSRSSSDDGADPPIDGSFTPPENSLKSRLITKVEDHFNSVRKTQGRIEEAGGVVTPESDVSNAQDRMHGLLLEDAARMESQFTQPLAELQAEHGISTQQLNLFMHAKHAPERNAYLASQNPALADGGSGMTNQQAAAIVAEVEASGQLAQYEAMASKVYAMQTEAANVRYTGGRVDEAGAWRPEYEFYVPLQGTALDEGGAGVRQNGAPQPASVTSTVMDNLAQTLVSNRENDVGNTFLNLVEANPNPDFWRVETTVTPEMAQNPNKYFATERNGQKVYIRVENPRVLKAMRSLRPEQGNALVQGLNTLRGMLKTINDAYDPQTVAGNFAKDVQLAVFKLNAEQSREDGQIRGEQIVTNTINDLPKATRAIYRSVRGKSAANPEWNQWYEEFKSVGGRVGAADFPNAKSHAKTIDHLASVSRGGVKGNARKFSRDVHQLVMDINQTNETAVRFSAYVNARKAGVSQEQAAKLALNLTVNTNRQGEIGSLLTALYSVADESTRSVRHFSRSMVGLKGQRGDPVWSRFNNAQKLAVTVMTGSYALAAANRMVAGEDEDGKNRFDKVPAGVKEKNLIIMDALWGGPQDGSYTTIPLPQMYNLLFLFGTTSESVLNGGRKVGDGATDMVNALLGAMSPIGFSGSDDDRITALKTATPTLLKPFVDIAVNEDGSGNSIYNNDATMPMPNSQQAQRSTPQLYRDLASWLNTVTGGDKDNAGALDLNPDVMKYVVESFGGAPAKEGGKWLEAGHRNKHGIEVESHDRPFLGAFRGKVSDADDIARFDKRWKEISGLNKEYNALKGVARYQFRRENKAKLDLLSKARRTEERMKMLRRRRDNIEKKGLSPKERDAKLKHIENLMDQAADRFNKAYNRAMDS